MNNYLWVVEMYMHDSKQWEATVGCGISRQQGRDELNEWKHNNPSDRFRIRKYRREEQ